MLKVLVFPKQFPCEPEHGEYDHISLLPTLKRHPFQWFRFIKTFQTFTSCSYLKTYDQTCMLVALSTDCATNQKFFPLGHCSSSIPVKRVRMITLAVPMILIHATYPPVTHHWDYHLAGSGSVIVIGITGVFCTLIIHSLTVDLISLLLHGVHLCSILCIFRVVPLFSLIAIYPMEFSANLYQVNRFDSRMF